MRLLSIIPCHNEGASIAEVVREVFACRTGMDVLVIDDGSTDDSVDIAMAAGARVVSLPYNMGIGSATQLGYRYANENGYDAAVQIDGDGQHDPAELHKILGPIESGKADLVVGSRFIEKEGFQSTAVRRVGISLFAKVLSWLTGERVTDPTSGFRAAGRRTIKLFAAEYPEDYPGVESIYLSHLAGLKVSEVPVLMRSRSGGRSSITPLRSVYYVIKVTLVLLVWMLRKKPTMEV